MPLKREIKETTHRACQAKAGDLPERLSEADSEVEWRVGVCACRGAAIRRAAPRASEGKKSAQGLAFLAWGHD